VSLSASSEVYFRFIFLRHVAERSDSGKEWTMKEREKLRQNEIMGDRENKETK
jgi:hypothetical protein